MQNFCIPYVAMIKKKWWYLFMLLFTYQLLLFLQQKYTSPAQHASKEGQQFSSYFRFQRAKLAANDPFFPYAVVARSDSQWFLLPQKKMLFKV